MNALRSQPFHCDRKVILQFVASNAHGFCACRFLQLMPDKRANASGCLIAFSCQFPWYYAFEWSWLIDERLWIELMQWLQCLWQFLYAVHLSSDLCRDILLLEVGFLTILLSPLTWFPVCRWKWFYQHDTISLWLVKWLLFRLMFSSGIVKLTSGCPTWWNLTGKLAYCVHATVLLKPIDWGNV